MTQARKPFLIDSPRSRAFLLLSVALAATACSDSPVAVERSPPLSTHLALVQGPERVALTALTRAVAMAMDNEGLRNQVRNDMRRSLVTREHKLEFRSYVKGRSGGILMAQMAKATGWSRDSLGSLIEAVRPLEFYMPVREQRDSWTGAGDLWVASLLKDADVPAAFDLEGRAVELAAWEKPAIPTLSIVPVETDFSRQLDTANWRPSGEGNDRVIGTMLIADPGDDGGGNSPTSSTDDALYLTYADVRDLHEPWLRGDPELETHVHGPTSEENPRWGMDLACAGEGAYDPRRYYNQDGRYFSRRIGSGAPLLFDRREIQTYHARFPGAGYHLLMWEDDNASCEIKTDLDLAGILSDAASAAAAAAAVSARKGGKERVIAAAIAFAVHLIKNSIALLKGNDDFVGAIIEAAESNYASQAAGLGVTHVIMNGGTFSGWASIEGQWATSANGRSYATSVTPTAASVAIDQTGSQQASATVHDQYGAVRSGHFVGWRSAAEGIAKVSPSGLITGVSGGTTTIYARACDPDCVESPVDVRITGPTLSGPGSVYDANATLIAGVANPRQSSYYYVWEYRTCPGGGGCDGWSSLGAGLDMKTRSVFVSRYDRSVDVRVTLKTSSYGAVVGTTYRSVDGAGEPPPGGSGCDDTSQGTCEPY
ncbi:MAG: Ig-like domain-containing protein [Gemmatimonadaceae bacterium]